jgi:hypothetical protein
MILPNSGKPEFGARRGRRKNRRKVFSHRSLISCDLAKSKQFFYIRLRAARLRDSNSSRHCTASRNAQLFDTSHFFRKTT